MEAQYNLLSSINNRELKHDNELDDERNVVDERNKMAAYAFPAVLSSQAFPRHRVQKLLNRFQYKGVSAEVEAEGLFIQLTRDGFPFRQVFLGLTQREFCIVKQEIRNFKSILRDKRDTETADLAIDQIIPLPVVRFLILDDSSKYFTILTYPGIRYRFEMCQLDSGSEEMWQKWRETILGLSEDPKCTDLNTWKTSYVIALNSGTAARSKVKSAYSKPLGFVTLRTIGIQANTECITGADTASNGNAIQTAHDIDLETDIDSSSSAEFDSFEKTRIGYHPKDRLAVLFTRGRFSPYYDTEDVMRSDRECIIMPYIEDTMRPDTGGIIESDTENIMRPDIEDVVWPDTEYTMRPETENIMRPDTDTIMRPGTEYIKKLKPRKTMSLNDLLDLQCQMLDKSTMEPCFSKKLSKARDKEFESSSESDDDIDEWKREVKYKMEEHETVRSARDLWSLVRSYVVRRKKFKTIGRFQDIVHHVHFRKLSQRDDALAQSIRQLDVTDVSLQLAYMSRKLFLAMSATELEAFTRSRGKEILRSIQETLKFSEDIRKMVITEVLKSRSLSGSIYVLKFFIQVGLKLLFELHDFQSLMAIVRGLTSLPLYRLDNMWLTLFVQEPFAFCHFLTLVQFLNPSKQHAAYVARVSTCLRRKTPFIPLLDHILEHCLKCKNKKHGDSHPWQYKFINTDTMYKKHDSSKMFKKSAFGMPTADTDLSPHKDKQRSDGIPEYETKNMTLPEGSDTQDSPNKKSNLSPQPVLSLRPFLSRNTRKRHSFKQILFKGFLTDMFSDKQPKHQVTSEIDPDTQRGLGKEEDGKMLKQPTNTRIVYTGESGVHGIIDNPGDVSEETGETYRHVSEKNGACGGTFSEANDETHEISVSWINRDRQEESVSYENIQQKNGKSCEDDDKYGESYGAACKETELLNTSFKNDWKKSPPLMYYFDYKARNILTSAVKEATELTEHDEMSMDSEDDSSTYSDASLPDSQQDKNKLEDGFPAEDYSKGKDIESTSAITQIGARKLNTDDIKHLEHKRCDYDDDDVNNAKGKNEANTPEKEKTTKSPQKMKKKFVFVKKILKSFGKARKSEFKHVKVLQNDIDEIADLMDSFKIFDFEEDENVSTVENNNTTETSVERNEQFKENIKSVQDKESSFETIDANEVKNKAPNDKNKPTDVTRGQSYVFKKNSKSVPDKKRSFRQFDIEEKGQMLTMDTNNVRGVTNNQNDEFKTNVNYLPGMKRSSKQFDIKEDGNIPTDVSNNVTDVTSKQNDEFKTNTKSLPSIKVSIEQFDTDTDEQISPVDKSKSKKRKTKSFSDLSRNFKIFDTKKNIKGASEEVIGHKFKTTTKSVSDKMILEETDIDEDKSVTADRNNATEAMVGQKFKKTAKALHHIMKFRKMVNDEELDNIATVDKNNEEEATIDRNDGIKTDTDALASMPRRKSYVPEIVARGRRKSMFGEAIANKIEDEDDTDTFEHLKNVKLCELKKKRSIVFDLLSPDEEEFVEDDRKSEPSINVSKRSLMESVTNLFRNNNKSNSNIETTNDKYSAHIHNSGRKFLVRLNAEININITYETESIPLSDDKCHENLKWLTESLQENFNQNSLNMLIKSDHDIDYSGVASSDVNRRLEYYDNVAEKGSDNDFCSLCGNNVCLYKSGIGNHILHSQINLLKMKENRRLQTEPI